MTPQQALTSLQENLTKLQSAGNLFIQKKKAYMMIEAEYIDAETNARELYFKDKPCKISELRDWVKMKSGFEYAAERKAHSELGAIKIQYDIILETINVLKISIKLMQDEMKNLNNQL